VCFVVSKVPAKHAVDGTTGRDVLRDEVDRDKISTGLADEVLGLGIGDEQFRIGMPPSSPFACRLRSFRRDVPRRPEFRALA